MKLRHELKHRISTSDLLVLSSRLSALFPFDEHCEEDGTYFVKSLYFDDYRDSALLEKENGVKFREKFRIRYYGDDTEYINLEKKSKLSGLCIKNKARITSEECESIISGDLSFAAFSERPLLSEFYAKGCKLLRPKCIVAYRRKTFICPVGNVRITLDYDLCASNDVRNFLNPKLPLIKIPTVAILEVKYDELLPDIVRDAVGLRGRKASAFSKYAIARGI